METKEKNSTDDNGNPIESTLPTLTDQTQVQPIITDFEPMENCTDNRTVNIVNPSGSTSRTCPTKVKITITAYLSHRFELINSKSNRKSLLTFTP